MSNIIIFMHFLKFNLDLNKIIAYQNCNENGKSYTVSKKYYAIVFTYFLKCDTFGILKNIR